MFYRTDFRFGCNVQQERFNEAESWLKERSRVLRPPNNKITHIIWQILTCSKGFVEVDISEKLTEQELKELSKWIKDQCENGIGKDFEEEFSYLDPEFYDDPLGESHPTVRLEKEDEDNIFEEF